MTPQQQQRCRALWNNPAKFSKRAIMQLINIEAAQTGQPPVTRNDVWRYILRDLCGFTVEQLAVFGLDAPTEGE